MRKRKGVSVEVDNVFYESCMCAGRIIGYSQPTIKARCLSDKFPNYKIVPYKTTCFKKECTKCGINKPLNSFYTSPGSKDGHINECKSCREGYRRVNKEHKKEYRESRKEETKITSKKYREEHKEETSRYNKKYNEGHRDKINARDKNRYKTDISYRIHEIMSTNIWSALKGKKEGKGWLLLVDYTVEELRAHLESKFTEGMSWDNMGKGGWGIDHIIAKSKFNVTSYECQEFKDCWALDNLQPLWEARNQEKGIKPMHPKYLIKPENIEILTF